MSLYSFGVCLILSIKKINLKKLLLDLRSMKTIVFVKP